MDTDAKSKEEVKRKPGDLVFMLKSYGGPQITTPTIGCVRSYDMYGNRKGYYISMNYNAGSKWVCDEKYLATGEEEQTLFEAWKNAKLEKIQMLLELTTGPTGSPIVQDFLKGVENVVFRRAFKILFLQERRRQKELKILGKKLEKATHLKDIVPYHLELESVTEAMEKDSLDSHIKKLNLTEINTTIASLLENRYASFKIVKKSYGYAIVGRTKLLETTVRDLHIEYGVFDVVLRLSANFGYWAEGPYGIAPEIHKVSGYRPKETTKDHPHEGYSSGPFTYCLGSWDLTMYETCREGNIPRAFHAFREFLLHGVHKGYRKYRWGKNKEGVCALCWRLLKDSCKCEEPLTDWSVDEYVEEF